ncbi:MAG: DUF488 family protein [Chitinophagales bacterium]|nr:DUF488 family protein [Chitinophagales bacterium]
MNIRIKRIYDSYDKDDGYRILVDRLWPRGISKADVALDEWEKEIAPSNELRKWFNHQVELYDEFKQRYKEELKDKTALLQHIAALAKNQTVTILYGAKDTEHNQAVVLLELLKEL